MRTWLVCGGSLSTIAIALATQGCSALPDNCENRGTCTNSFLEGIDSGAPGDDDAATEPPDAGADNAAQEVDAADGAIPSCDNAKAPSEDGCVINDGLGVFVSPAGNDATGDGTRALPFATLAKGVSAAVLAGKRVYACAATYRAPLVIGVEQDGAQIFGGLDCTTWQYSGEKARIAPTSAGVALVLDALATGASLTDVAIDALPAAGAGASSVAVFASTSKNVQFTRVAIHAGDAQDGAPGTTFTNYDESEAPFGINAASAAGAAAGRNACHDDTTSSSGGDGAMAGGAPARDGTSVPAVGEPNGGLSGNSQCKDGLAGADGAGVTSGGGLGASSSGALGASGWTTRGGNDGANGRPGQGGGGGGAKGVVAIGGGGGGAGGCGGGKGTGGQTGGSSIAILSFRSTIVLRATTATAGNGGSGGKGGAGQPGQTGGDPGAGVCNGGPGGTGSGGAGGGGGGGGVSAGVLWSGVPPTIDGQSTPDAAAHASVVIGNGGVKGLGGAGAHATGSGAPGVDGADGAAGFAKAIAQAQ